MTIEVGSILEGRVTGITNFGAFVELGEGKTGLVHISEVADDYVHDIKDYLKENDIVKVKVINIKDGKIGLSIRQVNNPSPAARKPARGRGRTPKSFEDKLSRFLRESEERLAHLRKSTDAKRGGRGTRRGF
ncbi:MAG: S1 RNA-binding domain-containing protein [Limnochordales bacterium]|nr:RNA-binding protein S1 [Bacillota bacterium]REJ36341.1 MAG: RNA-binding protein S1 [Bacillota bacterium]